MEGLKDTAKFLTVFERWGFRNVFKKLTLITKFSNLTAGDHLKYHETDRKMKTAILIYTMSILNFNFYPSFARYTGNHMFDVKGEPSYIMLENLNFTHHLKKINP